jgi:hypothetical protein
MAVVRTDGMCWSLANAFEKPVTSKENKGLISTSIEALDIYWGEMQRLYGGETYPVTAMLDCDAELIALKGSQVVSVEDWTQNILNRLPKE